jgi:hypothetical protein
MVAGSFRGWSNRAFVAEWIAQQLTNLRRWLAKCAAIRRPSWGSRLRRRVHSARAGHERPGSTDRATLAVAKWICGEAHRLDPT